MSFLTVAPDMVTAAAGNLESVGSALNEAAAAAAPATVGLAAPAADRVSAVVAAMLGHMPGIFKASVLRSRVFITSSWARCGAVRPPTPAPKPPTSSRPW